jgi:chitinase
MDTKNKPKQGMAPDEDFLFAGLFKAGDSWDAPPLRLTGVSGNYNMVLVAYAVLDETGSPRLETNDRNITPYLVKTFKKEARVKMWLTVGGDRGNFHFLASSEAVCNFYNSLQKLYLSWKFDGVNFDIRQPDPADCPFIIKAIQWFKQRNPGAGIMLTAGPTSICPDVNRLDSDWNAFVPLIDELGVIIDGLVVRAFDYREDYYRVAGVPWFYPLEMPEYIFNSAAEPFDLADGKRYNGLDARKIILGLPSSREACEDGYITSDEVKQVVDKLREKHSQGIGGIMIQNINDDAKDDYQFSNALKSLLSPQDSSPQTPRTKEQTNQATTNASPPAKTKEQKKPQPIQEPKTLPEPETEKKDEAGAK